MDGRPQNLKRKRENDYPRVTFTTATRNFDRLLKEDTLDALKTTVRKKLGIAPAVPLYLTQLRGGTTVDLEDEDDFEAFCAAAQDASVITVRVATTPGALKAPPAPAESAPPSQSASADTSKTPNKRKEKTLPVNPQTPRIQADAYKTGGKPKGSIAESSKGRLVEDEQAAEEEEEEFQRQRKKRRKHEGKVASETPSVAGGANAARGHGIEKPKTISIAVPVKGSSSKKPSAVDKDSVLEKKRSKKRELAEVEDAETLDANTEKKKSRKKAKKLAAPPSPQASPVKEKKKKTKPSKEEKTAIEAKAPEETNESLEEVLEKYGPSKDTSEKSTAEPSSVPENKKKSLPKEHVVDDSSDDDSDADVAPVPPKKAPTADKDSEAPAKAPAINGKPTKTSTNAKTVPPVEATGEDESSPSGDGPPPKDKTKGKAKSKTSGEASKSSLSSSAQRKIQDTMDSLVRAVSKKAKATSELEPTSTNDEDAATAPEPPVTKKSGKEKGESKKAAQTPSEVEDNTPAPATTTVKPTSKEICEACGKTPWHSKSRCGVRKRVPAGLKKYIAELKADQEREPTAFREEQIRIVQAILAEKSEKVDGVGSDAVSDVGGEPAVEPAEKSAKAKTKETTKEKEGNDLGTAHATTIPTTSTTATTSKKTTAQPEVKTTAKDGSSSKLPKNISVAAASSRSKQPEKASTSEESSIDESSTTHRPVQNQANKNATKGKARESTSDSAQDIADSINRATVNNNRGYNWDDEEEFPSIDASDASRASVPPTSKKPAVNQQSSDEEEEEASSDEEEEAARAKKKKMTAPPALQISAPAKPRASSVPASALAETLRKAAKVPSSDEEEDTDASDDADSLKKATAPATTKGRKSFAPPPLGPPIPALSFGGVPLPSSYANVSLDDVIRGPRKSLNVKAILESTNNDDGGGEDDDGGSAGQQEEEGLVLDEDEVDGGAKARRMSRMLRRGGVVDSSDEGSDEEEEDGQGGVGAVVKRDPRASLAASVSVHSGSPEEEEEEDDEEQNADEEPMPRLEQEDDGEEDEDEEAQQEDEEADEQVVEQEEEDEEEEEEEPPSSLEHGNLSFGDVNGRASSMEIDERGDRAFSEALADDTAVFDLASLSGQEKSRRKSTGKETPVPPPAAESEAEEEEEEEKEEEEDEQEKRQVKAKVKTSGKDKHDPIESFDSPAKVQQTPPDSPIGDEADPLQSTPHRLSRSMKGQNGKTPATPASPQRSSILPAMKLFNSVAKPRIEEQLSAAKKSGKLAPLSQAAPPPTFPAAASSSSAAPTPARTTRATRAAAAAAAKAHETVQEPSGGQSQKPKSKSQAPEASTSKKPRSKASEEKPVSKRAVTRAQNAPFPATQPAPARTTRAAARRAASVQPEESARATGTVTETQESTANWETLPADPSSPTAGEPTQSMVDELQSVPEDEDSSQLFIASETQNSFPYSQWQNGKDKVVEDSDEEEEDEDEVGHALVDDTEPSPAPLEKGRPRRQSTASGFVGLSQIASQPRNFRTSLPGPSSQPPRNLASDASGNKRRKTMASLYGDFAQNPKSDSDDSDSDEEKAAPKSHIPKGRRAGAGIRSRS